MPPPAPVAQLAPALVSLSRAEGSSVLTLRLEPAALGQVEVKITRPPDGPSGVEVTATNPETLLLLVRDQPALREALDRAGIAVDPRSLSFHLAPPPAAPAAPAPLAGGAAQPRGFALGTGGAAPGGAPPGGAGAGGAAGRETAPRRRRASLDSPAGVASDAPISHSPGVRWMRAGLDITA